MSANTIITSVVTGGTNTHTTVAEEANAVATDFVTQGVVGAITLNTGSGGTGSFCVNADASPDMGVTIKAGQAYITATPSSQDSQVLRARASSDYTSYTINANSSGSTKYDWIYLQVSATNANNPASDASNVTSIYTSRSSSNTTDNGTPPTYGLLLAIVTVANGASSITNSNITDKRFNTSIGAQNGSLIVTQSATGQPAVIQAAGQDANVNLQLKGKGTGAVDLATPYKFLVYLNAATSYSGTATRVPFDTALFDTNTNVDISTNKGRFTAPIAGFYEFCWCVAASLTATSNFHVNLYKNGSTYLEAGDVGLTSSGTAIYTATGCVVIQLAATDYIEVYSVGTSSSTYQVGTGPYKTWFSGRLVSIT